MRPNPKPILLTCFALVLLVSGYRSYGQETLSVDSILYRTKLNDTIEKVLENKLIELAMTGPAYQAATQQNKLNELELKKAKNSWLNLLSISTNYNDQTFATGGNSTYVYPKYFFGLTIPLGIIFSQSTQVKSAKVAVQYSKYQQELILRSLKSDVLGKYRKFRNYNTLIEIQSELINDVIANAADTEEGFKNGTRTVDDYIRTQKSKNDELAKLMNLRLEQYLIKLEIEQVIGISLEEAVKQITEPATTPASK